MTQVFVPIVKPVYGPEAGSAPPEVVGGVGVLTSWMEVFQTVTRPDQHFDIVFNDGDASGTRWRWTPTYDVEAEDSTTFSMRVTAGKVVQLGAGAPEPPPQHER